jgi:DNA-binding MarR family transcriptional regulator
MTSAATNDVEIDALVANVLEAAGALRRHGDQQASVVGQTQTRWQVLSVLSDEPKTVPAAARRLGVTRQAVQRTADVLLNEGLIRAQANPAHASSPLFSLTARGRRAVSALTDENQPWNRRVASMLSPADVEVANAVLRQLVELCDGALGVRPSTRGERG